MKKIQCQRHQRGVAIITALLLTALAITIVASLFWQQQVQMRSMENQRLQLQTKWILRGGLDWAMVILRADSANTRIDTLDEPWATPLEETRLDSYVENGRTESDDTDATLSGYIVDAQSMYNLRNLIQGNAADPVEVMVYAKLLGALNLNASLAKSTAEAFAAKANKQGEALSKIGDFSQLDDLLSIPGYTPEILEALRNYVIILPQRTSVNINTAPAEILAARIDRLSISEANAIVEARKHLPFIDGDRIGRDLAVIAPNTQGITFDSNKINTQTEFFIVHSKVRLNRATLEMQVLIQRRLGGDTKIIWTREN